MNYFIPDMKPYTGKVIALHRVNYKVWRKAYMNEEGTEGMVELRPGDSIEDFKLYALTEAEVEKNQKGFKFRPGLFIGYSGNMELLAREVLEVPLKCVSVSFTKENRPTAKAEVSKILELLMNN